MQYITDLEVHSKYLRAVSPKSDLEHHAEWADNIDECRHLTRFKPHDIIVIQTVTS